MKIALLLTAVLIVAVLYLIATGALGGNPPSDLGVVDGRLKPPSATRNSVSSQAALHPNHPQQANADIQPFPLKSGGAAASLQALLAVLDAMPNIGVVEQKADYVYARAQTRWMKFVDDLEFWVNPSLGVIDLRSASRLGREDFGVNRARIEMIRAAYLAHQ